MRALLSALWKDLRLFLSGAGLLALILPVALLPALKLGMADLGAGEYLSSFPIAVRDEDNTVMSRSLISQLRNIELFSEVRVLEEGVTDEEALADGAVAVATVPRDFFYEIYRMADCPVNVTLNADTPTQSALFEAIFRSVMGLIRANHASALGTYTYAYGELTDDLVRQMRRETGDRLVVDALGRQRVFETVYASADLAGALTRRLSACVLGVLALFFAVCSAKTVPEERRLGVLPRFRTLGRGTWGFAVSKLLSALLLSLPAVALVASLTELGFWPVLALYALLLLAAFGVCLLLCALAASPAAQRWANLLLLLSLALGGTLWPVSALPAPLRALRYLALPYYAQLGLEAAAAGLDLSARFTLLWPVGAAAVVFLPLSVALVTRPGGGSERGRRGVRGASEGARDPLSEGDKTANFTRFWNVSAFRAGQLAGRGGVFLLCAAVTAALCGVSASSIGSKSPAKLRLAAVDLDGTELSGELITQIASAPGVSLETVTAREAELALVTGAYEGILTVGEGYGDAVSSMSDTPLTFDAPASSLTSQGAREIVAGAVLTQERAVSSISDAERLTGKTLTELDISDLRRCVTEAEKGLPRLYNIATSSGSTPADPFAPTPMAFAALACLFTLLTAASTFEVKTARRRLKTAKFGHFLSVFPDLLALTGLGLLTVLFVLLPSGLQWTDLLPSLAASLALASLALLITRASSAAGRVDALAPLLALLICLLGGCFLNPTSLPPLFQKLTLLSPAGLALAAATSLPALLALLAESAIFTALAARK